MKHPPPALLDAISRWDPAARDALWRCRTLFHQATDELNIGSLGESLKWGQPAWRPVKPRTGATLRMSWDPETPEVLKLFVDCKTDLAARMQSIYPQITNDGRRVLQVHLGDPLPEEAIAHLAEMTFCYHMSQRQRSALG